jgi:monovalent cation:H+ antiporter-2, CPA2 family
VQEYPIIRDIVIILFVSIPIVFIFNKFRIPSIVGFLIAGILIGPHVFKLITEIEQIEMMAEIGVILLLFTIGLEISLQRLMQMRRFLIVAGGLQVSLTIIITGFLFYLVGIPLNQSVFFGMLLSLSSTAIVLKLLDDKNELEAPHGRIAVGMLIFQDIAIVPMILFVPVLALAGDVRFGMIALQFLVALLAIGIIIVLARFFIPKIIYQMAKLRIREVFTIGTLLLILGTAHLTEMAGLSLALGAFIAGLMISESEFSHQVFADIIPLKDAFISIFFVSIGLLLNVQLILEVPLVIIVLIIGIVVIKSGIIVLVIRYMKFPTRTALIAGLSLAQVGEFSFVLASVGIMYNILPVEYYHAFLASSIFTMLLTPLLVHLAPMLAIKVSGLQSAYPFVKQDVTDSSLKHHVIIVGYGLNGQNVARVLKETGIPYIIIELNPETVNRLNTRKEKVIFGDVTRRDILDLADVRTAKCIVFAISDPGATAMGLKLVNQLNPDIFTIVRARNTIGIEDLKRFGADVIIPEEFETSLQIFSKVLENYHIPVNVIMRQMAILRSESYQMMVKEGSGISSLTHIDEILAAGITETYYVDDDNVHIGKTLSELDLRAQTDATIIAIVRNGKTITGPPPSERITLHDTYVLVGDHKSVDRAIQLLDAEI